MGKMRRAGSRPSGCIAHVAVAAILCLYPLYSFAVDIEVSDEVQGYTPSYIGANEGGQFSMEYMVDCGINAYRLFAGMNRTEPQDDGGTYGSPSIAEIKADPSGSISWSTWDGVLGNASYWWYEPAFAGYVEDLRAHGIEPIICLRNREGANPSWAPPQNGWDEADWNEWWTYCFAIAYWCNVRNDFNVTRFEVHNEPDYLTQDWTGTQEQYVELVEKASDAVRFANAIAGIETHIHAPVVANYSSSYVHSVLASADSHVDVLDFHTYATDVAPSVQHVRTDIQTYNPDGLTEPIWVSEWGLYSGSYDTFTRGATTCRQLYSFATEGVEGLCIFPFFDWGGFNGLVSSAGAKTETYYAYRLMLKGLCGGKEVLSVTSSDPSKKVIVSRDSGNLYVIAVDAGETVNVDLSDLGIDSGEYAVYEYSSSRKDSISAYGSFTSGGLSFSAPSSGASCAVLSPDEAMAGFSVGAWMPTAWDFDNSRDSFNNNLDVLTEISPGWYKLWKNDGRIQARDNAPPDPDGVQIVNTSQDPANGIIVLPMISNSDNGWNADRVHSVITDRDNTKNHISKIIEVIEDHGYEGIDVDYENLYAADRDAFSAFIRRLSRALHERGHLLSIAVHAKTSEPGGWNGPQAQDWYRLGRDVDRFRIMTYDYSGSWSGPGPIAPTGWADDVLEFAGGVVARGKTQMGIPFYGYDWIEGGDADGVTWLEVNDIITAHAPTLLWHATYEEPYFSYSDGSSRTVWYQDSQSIACKIDEAMSRKVGGIAIWRLGSENDYGDPGIDSGMWTGIRENDYDGDGLTLPRENTFGTDPTMADTDGGGTDDAQEVSDGTDPLTASDDLDADPDGDGLSSRDENGYGTNPDEADSDGDGLSDYQEVHYDAADGGYCPHPSGSDTNANSADTDGDSFSDSIEGICSGDPLDAGVTPDVIRVNFQPHASTRPSLFCSDGGYGYSGSRGHGWR